MSAHGKNFWGPPIWTTFHILSATYKPEHVESYLCFLNSLKDLLPCDVCRENFRKVLHENPPDSYLGNHHDTFWYSYIIHDAVNQHVTTSKEEKGVIGKKSPPYEQVKHHYFKSLGKDCQQCKTSMQSAFEKQDKL